MEFLFLLHLNKQKYHHLNFESAFKKYKLHFFKIRKLYMQVNELSSLQVVPSNIYFKKQH